MQQPVFVIEPAPRPSRSDGWFWTNKSKKKWFREDERLTALLGLPVWGGFGSKNQARAEGERQGHTYHFMLHSPLLSQSARAPHWHFPRRFGSAPSKDAFDRAIVGLQAALIKEEDVFQGPPMINELLWPAPRPYCDIDWYLQASELPRDWEALSEEAREAWLRAKEVEICRNVLLPAIVAVCNETLHLEPPVPPKNVVFLGASRVLSDGRVKLSLHPMVAGPLRYRHTVEAATLRPLVIQALRAAGHDEAAFAIDKAVYHMGQELRGEGGAKEPPSETKRWVDPTTGKEHAFKRRVLDPQTGLPVAQRPFHRVLVHGDWEKIRDAADYVVSAPLKAGEAVVWMPLPPAPLEPEIGKVRNARGQKPEVSKAQARARQQRLLEKEAIWDELCDGRLGEDRSRRFSEAFLKRVLHKLPTSGPRDDCIAVGQALKNLTAVWGEDETVGWRLFQWYTQKHWHKSKGGALYRYTEDQALAKWCSFNVRQPGEKHSGLRTLLMLMPEAYDRWIVTVERASTTWDLGATVLKPIPFLPNEIATRDLQPPVKRESTAENVPSGSTQLGDAFSKCVAGHPDYRRFVVVASCGTGKSHLLLPLIENAVLPGEGPVDTFLYIVSLRMLATGMHGRLDSAGVVDYLDVPRQRCSSGTPDLTIDKYPKLINNVKSLWRIALSTDKVPSYDFVVLDEIEKLLEFLCSDIMVDDERGCYALFVAIIRKAKRVLITDADYSDRAHEFFTAIFDGHAPKVVINPYLKPRVFDFRPPQFVLSEVESALKSGRKVGMATTTRAFGHQVAQEGAKLLANAGAGEDEIVRLEVESKTKHGTTVQCITAFTGTDRKLKPDVIGPALYAARFVIFNGCAEVGVSFDSVVLPDGTRVDIVFDLVVGLYTATTTLPRGFWQLLCRCRNNDSARHSDDGQTHVLVANATKLSQRVLPYANQHVTADDIALESQIPEGAPKAAAARHLPPEYARLQAWHSAQVANRDGDFERTLCTLLEEKGFSTTGLASPQDVGWPDKAAGAVPLHLGPAPPAETLPMDLDVDAGLLAQVSVMPWPAARAAVLSTVYMDTAKTIAIEASAVAHCYGLKWIDRAFAHEFKSRRSQQEFDRVWRFVVWWLVRKGMRTNEDQEVGKLLRFMSYNERDEALPHHMFDLDKTPSLEDLDRAWARAFVYCKQQYGGKMSAMRHALGLPRDRTKQAVGHTGGRPRAVKLYNDIFSRFGMRFRQCVVDKHHAKEFRRYHIEAKSNLYDPLAWLEFVRYRLEAGRRPWFPEEGSRCDIPRTCDIVVEYPDDAGHATRLAPSWLQEQALRGPPEARRFDSTHLEYEMVDDRPVFTGYQNGTSFGAHGRYTVRYHNQLDFVADVCPGLGVDLDKVPSDWTHLVEERPQNACEEPEDMAIFDGAGAREDPMEGVDPVGVDLGESDVEDNVSDGEDVSNDESDDDDEVGVALSKRARGSDLQGIGDLAKRLCARVPHT